MSSVSKTALRPARPPCLVFFNDTATTEIYTLSLHDALPISGNLTANTVWSAASGPYNVAANLMVAKDRKSTRLNSSHSQISYAVFRLVKRVAEPRSRARAPDPLRASARGGRTPG